MSGKSEYTFITPWKVGIDSVRANRLPMVILWLAAASVVFAYYASPGFAGLLEPLSRWQKESGWVAAFLNRVVFCGALPGFFMVTVPALRPKKVVAAITVQTLWSGICGIVSDLMFSANAAMFGTGIDFMTLTVKTSVNQFVWTPLFFSPLGSLVYFWIGHDFSLEDVRRSLSRRFYHDLVLPNLLVNWALWIPATYAIHMFPTPLQIQLAGLASALLSLMMLAIGRRGSYR
jgi:hypothetical protein